MIPAYVDLGSQTEGDTWEGLEIGPVVDQDSNPMPHPCASCRIDFRHKISGMLGVRLTSIPTTVNQVITVPATILILDANAWLFSIPELNLGLKAGPYEWEFETTDTSGVVRSLYSGDLVIVVDITHD